MDDFIEYYDGALSPGQCRQLVEKFEASGKVTPGRAGATVNPKRKNSLDITITHHREWRDEARMLEEATRPHLERYMEKYHFLLVGPLVPNVKHPKTGESVPLDAQNFDELGRPIAGQLVRMMYRFGDINLQKYLAGQGHYAHWHSENYPQDTSAETLYRVLLWSYYLNDVPEAGETEFFYQKRKIAPRAGRLVIAPAYFTHTHRGNISPASDKYIATSWILYQRAETLFGNAARA